MLPIVRMLVPALLGALVAAQSSGRIQPLPVAVDDGAGLEQIDGGLVGAGRDYKAYFTRDGVEFVPALGARAPHNMPLHLRGIAAGRGEELAPLLRTEPEFDELRVRYPHGTCTERYDVRSDGMEQSFVFDHLPPGKGDLVVRCSCATDLPRAAAEPGETVRFASDDFGGVAIGRVEGFDARGRRVRGSARYDAGELELRLPAGFVDVAELPLVLDPVIASVPVDRGPEARYQPEAAWVPGRWAVVYTIVFSGSDQDVRMREIDTTTLALSGILQVAASNNVVEHSPAVAGVAVADAFFVVFVRENPPVGGIIHDKLYRSGVVSGGGSMTSGNRSSRSPTISGGVRSFEDKVVIAWVDETSNSLRGTRVEITATGVNFDPTTVITIAPSGTRIESPDLTQNRGFSLRRGLTYALRPNSGPGGGVRVGLLDPTLTLHGVTSLEGLSGSTTARAPRIDGNGQRWLVAYEFADGAGSFNIATRTVANTASSNTLTVSARRTIVSNVADVLSPSVAVLGHGVLIGWTWPGLFSLDSGVGSFEIDDCRDCEGRSTVVVDLLRNEYAPRIATEYDPLTGEPLERALLAVDRDSGGSFTGGIYAYTYESVDGEQTPLADQCFGGRLTAPCALVGNQQFRIRMTLGPPNTATFLALSLDRMDLSCGTCTLLPDVSSGWLLAATTDPTGRASIAAPIPPGNELRGFGVYAQWLHLATLVGFCQIQGTPLDLSDGQLIRIE